MKNYYLSIKKDLLAYLMDQALIYPIYDSLQKDIPIEQRKYGNLILQNEKKYINNDDCILQIALNDEEIPNLKKSKISQDIYIYIYIYNKPLPISRISKIFFKNDTYKLNTIFDITTTAPINAQICDIFNENENLKIAENELEEIKKYDYSDELKSSIKKYDQILGGIAFARYDINEDYNENYFSILSYFNDVFKDELNKNKLEINENFKGAFGFEQKNVKKGIEEFWKKLYAIIYEPIKKEDVEKSAKDENITITTKTAALFDFEHIKTSTRTYNLAILQIYSQEKSSKSIDDLISGFRDGKIPKDKQEGISLLIGINNGYKSFTAEHKFVKFKMDSLLDYYTIESIFQHAINNKQNCSSFEYIDKIAPKKQEDEFNLDKKIISHYILDEAVYKNETYFDECLYEFKNNEDDTGLKANLRNILQKFVDLVNAYLKKNSELEEKNKTLESENEELKNNKEMLKKDNERIESEKKSLKENNKTLEDEKKALESDKELLDKKNKTLESENEELKETEEILSYSTNVKNTIYTKEQLLKNTLDELKNICKNYKLKSYSKEISKDKLIRKIINYQNKNNSLQIN